jgi:AraC-like DNA-binding protein
VLDTPFGHLLGDYIMALERRLPDVTEADFPGITKAVGAMVAAAVEPSAARVVVAQQQIDLGRKERVRQAVRRHLRTPTLGPKNLGRLVGMSRSNLYRLFEDTGGVARYIQRERLLAARVILSDPSTSGPISAIAEYLCFADSSSFSRSFKREFGYAQSEARYAALSGIELDVTPKPVCPRREAISAISCASSSIAMSATRRCQIGTPGKAAGTYALTCVLQSDISSRTGGQLWLSTPRRVQQWRLFA